MDLSTLEIHGQEKVIGFIRHTWWILIPNVLISLAIALLDFFLMFYLFSYGAWGLVIFSLILFIVVFNLVRVTFLWNNSFTVLTDKRLIIFEQLGFFEKTSCAVNLIEIRLVQSLLPRGFAKLFHYGDLRLDLKNESKPKYIYYTRQIGRVVANINSQIIKAEETEVKTQEQYEESETNKI